MEIKFINVFFFLKKKLLHTVMRVFILLLCSTLFSMTPNELLSQNVKISIEIDKNYSVDEIFDMIKSQTNYRFIYKSGMFDNLPKVNLKKGKIGANELFEKSLIKKAFKFSFSNKNTIVIEDNQNAQIAINGKVTDSNGIGLPGVTVLEKGTNNGTSTDIEGNYTISTTNKNSILVYSFIGYSTQEIAVNEQTEINIILSESVFELEAVNIISTGYQKIARDKITGAAQNIEPSYYKNAFKQTLQESLQGSVAGLQIMSNNNHPQAVPQVIIRGVGSAYQEGVGVVSIANARSVLGDPAILTPGSPLYVIDGVPTFDGRDLTTINGADINSITILKDAAAASIYGARAANGVIVVETKSGNKGKSKVNYSYQIGFSEFTGLNERLNTQQLQELYIEGLINNATNGITTPDAALNFLLNPGGSNTPFNPNQNTNWADELTRNALMTQHNLSVSGGKDKNRFYLSLGYLKNESALKEIDFDRLNVRLKYDNAVSDKFNVSANIGYGKTRSNNYETGTSFYNPFRNIYLIRPDLKTYNDDGLYDLSYNFGVNPLGILTDEKRDLETNDFRGVLDLSYHLISNLTLETQISANYKLTENYNNFPKHIGRGLNTGGVNFGNQLNTNIFIWNARTMLKYNLDIDQDNKLEAFVGLEQNATDSKWMTVNVDNLRDGAETLDNGIIQSGDTRRRETSLSSLFLNTSYSYKDKYLFNASFRRDGSSRFGSSNKYGNFYAIGLGWNIHKEDVLNTNETINMLKLRASYGVNGNDQIDPFAYSGTFSGTGSYNNGNALTISSAGNASIGWEENATLDVGLDFSLYENRISGFIDYYSRKTSKLLYNLPVSSLNGDTFVFQNFGGMKNSGIEISLNSKNIISQNNGFSWSTSINFTTNKNEITELKSDENISGNYIRKVGEDFNTLYLYGYAGVDPETGTELYYTDETETETTSTISQAVKYNHGKTSPDYYGSFINTFTYKQFSLTAQLYTSWGGQIFETNGWYQNDNGYLRIFDYSNTSKYVYDNRWQNPGDVTDVPKYVYANSLTQRQSSRWLHDGSYIRLKRVELAYEFSKNMLEKTFMDRLSLSLSGDNLWTSIKDKTLKNDPEIGGITGASSFDVPISKTIYLGLNVSF